MSTFDPSKINFQVLPSVMDVQKYVQARMKVHFEAEEKIGSKIKQTRTTISSLGKLKEGIEGFQNASRHMMDRENLSAIKTSGDDEYVGISATSAARATEVGSVRVKQLAQSQTLVSKKKFDDVRAPLSRGENKLTITFGTVGSSWFFHRWFEFYHHR